jgi:23S rRNA (guanosine2251-2'-O)-methyltransferase
LDKNKSIIYGRHPVTEALESGTPLDKIYIKKGNRTGVLGKIRKFAAESQIPITESDDMTLSRISEGGNHQGVVALVSSREYDTLEDIFRVSREQKEDLFVLVLNEVQDTHNLGSLIRSAVGAGVHGIILPRRRSARLSPIVSKVAAGSDVYIKIALVTNIADTLETLKEKGLTIVGAEEEGEFSLFDFNVKGPIALVMGGEHKGLGQRVKNACDYRVKIPLRAPLESLNVGVAGGILLFKIVETRFKFFNC